MINIQVFDPHPLLANLVKNISVIDNVINAKHGPMIGQYPPTPQYCIILYIKAKFKAKKVNEDVFKIRSKAIIIGPQITRMELTVEQDHTVAIIGFLPGGLFRLLGIPMVDIFDEGYDGHDLIGSDIVDLVDRCAEMNSHYKIRDCIENYLLGKLYQVKNILPVDKALFHMLGNNGNTPITHIADLACLSLRQFERKCEERIGFSPKTFSRLIRFSHAYRLYERCPYLNWIDIALASGYYDQMHFIKDFKEFAGITPSMMEEELKRKPLRFQASLKI